MVSISVSFSGDILSSLSTADPQCKLPVDELRDNPYVYGISAEPGESSRLLDLRPTDNLGSGDVPDPCS